ncbi:serine hydrolase domain-containing protein [Umezawaea tangerina]|uniref:CubicO group peptidase (Beta-lactamase class C family) n=1 Tax=Umezawaea tangerina TaxID=84725 RepID=A0A2T0TKF4_9PSEU|nr:CubicO group peptidase (beta-lactamase class C family) [Umezawaea tangerina]
MRLPALLVATMLTMTTLPVAAHADPSTGRFDRPHTGFAPPWTQLHRGDPGLDRAPIDAALDQVRRYTEPDATGHPMFAGAVTLLAHDGSVVAQRPTGWAVRYSDAKGTELPVEQRVPMADNTIFDLASISKLFTSIVVMQQVERGRIRVDQPVSRYLPEFGVNGKADITVEQLLTHTSGLEPWLPLWQKWPDVPSRIKAVMDATPQTTPGTAYTYSDLNLITLGELVHRVSGSPLDELVRKGITEPLGLPDTGYNPPASKLDRIAATEFQTSPPRGMVRGQVHDENAWSLGGVAGHAGVFSTARDLAVLAQTVLNGGTYDGHRILRPQTVRLMLTNFNTEFPEDSHGLGFELDQRWYMGALSSPATAGHTGYTGTTLVVDPLSRSIAILLTNRVHPSRDWGTINPARRAVADGLARALAVRPQQGRDAWTPTATGATLTTGDLPGARKVSFDAFVDLDEGDSAVLQTGDGTTWRDVRTLTGTGTRKWTRVEAAVDGSRVRWVYTRGTGYGGRGVYVDGIRVTGDRGTVLDAERHPEALTAVGWRLADR